MAKLNNTREEVSGINNIVVDNNPISVIACLKSSSILLNDTGRANLIYTLENLFDTNKQLWVTVIKCIDYNINANNYTTNQELINKFLETYNYHYGISDSDNSRLNLSEILAGIAGFIGGSSTTTGQSTTTTSTPSINPIAIIVLAVTGILVILFLATRK